MEKVIDDKLIEQIEPYKYFGVGLHTIRFGNFEQRLETANNILKNGLKIDSSYYSINGNVWATGILGVDDEEISNTLSCYNYSAGLDSSLHKIINVIVLYPAIIKNSKGEKIYLGYTTHSEWNSKERRKSLMDIVCADLDYIPKEFIFGYYVDSDDKWKDTYFDKTYLPGEKHEHIYYDLVRNPNFCNGELVNDELFDLIKKILEEKEFKSYSDACVKSIENLDITYFEEEFMRNRIYFGQHFGWVGMSESYRDLLEDIHKDLVIRINCLPNENSLKK